jgi:hypothetical protein
MEHGKQPDDFDSSTGLLGQTQAVFEHPGPMGDTVVAVPRQRVLIENGLDDWSEVLGHDVLVLSGR